MFIRIVPNIAGHVCQWPHAPNLDGVFAGRRMPAGADVLIVPSSCSSAFSDCDGSGGGCIGTDAPIAETPVTALAAPPPPAMPTSTVSQPMTAISGGPMNAHATANAELRRVTAARSHLSRQHASGAALDQFQDRYTQGFAFPPISQKARNGWGTDATGTPIVDLL